MQYRHVINKSNEFIYRDVGVDNENPLTKIAM